MHESYSSGNLFAHTWVNMGNGIHGKLGHFGRAGYARRGELVMARQLFDEMPVKDLVYWNVMITGYAKRGEMESARKLFNEVPKRDVVTWNVMIVGYVLCGSHDHEQAFVEEMEIEPNPIIWRTLLGACRIQGNVVLGKCAND
ncbi:hypothetical protein IFM89_031405 [Coptis chinensis]|uniref:Pentatricopeptide repeat-containing protein n=1 Tax=Coptis chinensis TaxID=261450 RepID=A0A835HI34_9MAGN|nr:hypothetical protein IFM89_031405 [Coptis chinensis]